PRGRSRTMATSSSYSGSARRLERAFMLPTIALLPPFREVPRPMKITLGLLLAAFFLFFVSCKDQAQRGGDRGADGALVPQCYSARPSARLRFLRTPPEQAEIAGDDAMQAAGSAGSPLGPDEALTPSAPSAASVLIASSSLAFLEHAPA